MMPMYTSLPDFSAILPHLVHALPSVLMIVVGAVLLNYFFSRVLLFAARHARFTEAELGPVRRTVKWIISLVALVLVLGAFGLNIGGMWGIVSTILAMVAIGFVAVWSVLSNILCTLIILVFRPFSVGDEVEFAGEPVKGRVVDLNFIYTTLDAGDGAVMQVPNNLFLQKVLRRRHSRAAVSPVAHMRTKRSDIPDQEQVPARDESNNKLSEPRNAGS